MGRDHAFGNVAIVALGDEPAVLNVLEAWFIDEWPGWYGPDGRGEARQDLEQCLQPAARLPRCLVALDTDGRPLGTVSLRDTSPGSDLYPGAWLTALLVHRDFRKAGIGGDLIAAAERQAEQLGFPEILTATATARSLVLKRDWLLVETLQPESGPLGLYRKVLAADCPPA
ncbi:GNAT family N-acetyltransferase [Stappia sp. BW2]|uniref:GNAT family N-acetyltransferase n=1 Tax=Stappia sp. BW2 TaxID=2592622 RepID=UPI0011DEE644|nr:GNAT family N-acetyltransferase [Stappia sp. BW2]TYC66394.1 GNAT family N-acetyltransferase [Stappia sp. BW2]